MTDKDKQKLIPNPTGYHILCMVPEVEDRFSGSGLIKADETVEAERLLSTVLFVIKTGPDAYRDKKRFPGGPWCKEGDFILVRTHAGTRIKIHGKEFRIINDDTVQAVVQDPSGIGRA